MTTTAIRAPARPIYPELAPDLQEQVDLMAARVTAGANWKVRKKTLLDILVTLEALAALPKENREAVFRHLNAGAGTGADTGTGDAAEDGPEKPETLVLLYTGAILERLDEAVIASAEQAAMYSLSIHPEHGESVLDWMKADLYNARALKRLLRADRRFRTLQRAIDAAVGHGPGAEPPP